MPVTRQQYPLARKQSSTADRYKPKTGSKLRNMSSSEEPTQPDATTNFDCESTVPPHLRSWLPRVRSIDDVIPLPSDFVIAKPNEKQKPNEKPKSKDHSKNRALKASTVRQLNVRLRKYGLVMKYIVPAGVDHIQGVQSTSENIQSSEEFAEYEIVGMNGERKSWVFDRLAAAADEDKSDRLFKEQVEKEKAERSAAEEEDKEIAVGSTSEDNVVDGKGRKSAGSLRRWVCSMRSSYLPTPTTVRSEEVS